MKTTVFLLFAMTFTFISHAQENSLIERTDSMAFTEFKGRSGCWTMLDFLGTRVQYPNEAKENELQGKVTCVVYVDTLGNVKSIEAIESPHQVLSDEIIRVLSSSSGYWVIPRNEKDRPVDSYTTVSFQFLMNPDIDPSDYTWSIPISTSVNVDELIDPNDLPQSKKNLTQAYRGDPTNPEILFERGVIFYQLGNVKAACKDWKKANKFGSEEASQKLDEHCSD